MPSHASIIWILATCALLTACSRYQVTLNENVLYSPAPVFTDFTTEDPQLKRCLDQAIEDGEHRAASSLKQLICSHAGLTSLVGIEQFTGLEAINVAHNKLQTLKPLLHLSKLKTLLAEDNQLSTAVEVLTLPLLEQVNLQDNSKLACDDLQQWMKNYQGEVNLPEQCLP